MRLFKNFLGTVGLIIVVCLILALSKAIALIPVELILGFAYSNRWGILAGVLLSYAGIGISELFGKGKRFRRFRRWLDDDDEDVEDLTD